MNPVTRDPGRIGLRHGPIRFPDGKPPEPWGCRWCGTPRRQHHARPSAAVGWHVWAEPTQAQRLARLRARAKARRTTPCSEISLPPWNNGIGSFTLQDARDALDEPDAHGEDRRARSADLSTPRPERCEEMNHNSIGSEVECQLGGDHDGLCDDGTGFTWLGVRNEERGQ
ncbi:hypothetical protein [Streptomyces bacillaris]|uniref:hypothetical protein n=1 Tax=Streptomyces bacillaris TaxID=68179 RepID=UPI003634CA75